MAIHNGYSVVADIVTQARLALEAIACLLHASNIVPDNSLKRTHPLSVLLCPCL